MTYSSPRLTESPIINVISAGIFKAAKRLRRDFGELENLQISQKSPGDFVTQADLGSEKILYEHLNHAYPHYGFLMEEKGEIKGSEEARWIIDPLDGTTNFIHGIPHFSISVALEKRGVIVAGAIYDPIKDELFWAEKDRGAYLNNRRIRVSSRSKLAESLIISEMCLSTPAADMNLNLFKEIHIRAGFRSFGSAALDLAYVAAGRVEGYMEYNLKPWDVAAGIIIVQEAKGMVTPIRREDTLLSGDSIAATNQNLHEELLSLLKP